MVQHTNEQPCPSCAEKLKWVYPYLRDWFYEDVLISFPDAHVSWTYRGKEDQENCVKNHTSKLEWPKSAHNRRVALHPSVPFDPTNEEDRNSRPESLAMDLFQLDEKGIATWWPGFFIALAQRIKLQGRPLFWGGDWPSLGDRCHFQMHGIK